MDTNPILVKSHVIAAKLYIIGFWASRTSQKCFSENHVIDTHAMSCDNNFEKIDVFDIQIRFVAKRIVESTVVAGS